MSAELSPVDRARLNELGEKMKKAKGKELDAIILEVDKIIGHDQLCERDSAAEKEAQERWDRGCRESDS